MVELSMLQVRGPINADVPRRICGQDEQFLFPPHASDIEGGFVTPALFYVFWIALLTASMTLPSDATWKPEYAKNPPAVTAWFKEARVPGGCDSSQNAKAWNRLGICGCCEHADRLKTKFVADAEGDWSYYTDPECTTKECPLKPVPNDIVHQDGIHALNPYDDRLPEFDQMRREGVLFIYRGQPACFWPPEQSDG